MTNLNPRWKDAAFVATLTAVLGAAAYIITADWRVALAAAGLAALGAGGLAWRWKRKPLPCEVCGEPAVVTTGPKTRRSPLVQGTFCARHAPDWLKEALKHAEAKP